MAGLTNAPLTIALRSLGRRKVRMALIGALVVVGTFLIVFGGTFAASAQAGTKSALIHHLTGDLVLYSPKSKDLPSPFGFQTGLPPIENASKVLDWLNTRPEVDAFVGLAQNFAVISIQKDGRSLDLSYIFYAVEPERYQKTFGDLDLRQGSYFGSPGSGSDQGILISENQHKVYLDKYGIDLKAGDRVTLLSSTGGGAVNSVTSTLRGVFEPRYYANVFNYANLMDMKTYSQLFNFTGVAFGSLPQGMDQAFTATSDGDILALAGGDAFAKLDVSKLKAQELSGYTSVSVRLKAGADGNALVKAAQDAGFAVKASGWREASSFFATVADILQTVIYGATLLVFLIVVFILMNTLIINVLERTSEIGTYRALGADKGFVSAIFLWESFLLNLGASVVGVILSLALIVAIGDRGIQLPDVVAQYLVGGGPMKLELSPGPFVLGLVLVVAVSFLATLYPTRVAAGISPLKAMSGK